MTLGLRVGKSSRTTGEELRQFESLSPEVSRRYVLHERKWKQRFFVCVVRKFSCVFFLFSHFSFVYLACVCLFLVRGGCRILLHSALFSEL